MIKDIPTAEEFQISASDLLNTAWGHVTELLIEFDSIYWFIEGDVVAPEVTPDGEMTIRVPLSDEQIESNTEQFWRASKQTMSIALTLIQQAVEFYIKGRIVSISPHLLLTAPISSWPKKSNSEDVFFSSFKTIDAQDLIKVHDTVYKERFSDDFKRWYEKMRALRNKVMHSVARDTLKPEELIEAILYIHEYFGPNKWLIDRQIFLSHTPSYCTEAVRYSDNIFKYITKQVSEELNTVVDKLSPSVVSKYFDYDKRTRALLCPECLSYLIKLDSFELNDDESYFKPFQEQEQGFHQCVVCEYEDQLNFRDKECEVCEKSLIDEKSGFCLNCGDDEFHQRTIIVS